MRELRFRNRDVQGLAERVPAIFDIEIEKFVLGNNLLEPGMMGVVYHVGVAFVLDSCA